MYTGRGEKTGHFVKEKEGKKKVFWYDTIMAILPRYNATVEQEYMEIVLQEWA